MHSAFSQKNLASFFRRLYHLLSYLSSSPRLLRDFSYLKFPAGRFQTAFQVSMGMRAAATPRRS
ncbi:hypothetical protein HMPREF9123_1169 [Neisseria bacilliformis ATCC BAA-1200]|uniref:Uncharacterized protein n=1 Tax=Neisseria bacilliformis ATCC BAA-1200 TaxID=888742 RepID=F2BBR4_9NEIS|nr:hypothetical protein HMPREF9123_1169 [Neisseria bacilliformis ATCC BAA-1200]